MAQFNPYIESFRKNADNLNLKHILNTTSKKKQSNITPGSLNSVNQSATIETSANNLSFIS